MRILVVADIHGNRAALDAVAAVPHDAVMCLGDLVGFGPDPHACVQWSQQHAGVAVQGNHDWAAADPSGATSAGGIEPFVSWASATEALTRADLDATDRAYLAALPRWAILDINARRYLLVHATPSDPLQGVAPADAAAWRRELEAVDADVVIVAHTHHQFMLTVGRTTVVNPGSVGLPLDGDPRAAYALIDNGMIRLDRIPYSAADTIRGLRHGGVPADAVAGIGGVLQIGAFVKGYSPLPSGYSHSELLR